MHAIVKSHPDSNADRLITTRSIPGMRPLMRGADPARARGTRAALGHHESRADSARGTRAALGHHALVHRRWGIMRWSIGAGASIPDNPGAWTQAPIRV